MRRHFTGFTALTFLVFSLISMHAHAIVIQKPKIAPTPPSLTSKAHIMVDYYSHEVLASHNEDSPFPPASLTKLMTMYVVEKALQDGLIHLDDMVKISKEAWKMEGSRMFVQVDDTVKVADLIQGIIIQSGNDSCIAMAEHVAGSEASFVDLMNQYAQELEMRNTKFMNATGLPDEAMHTTARDLSKLAAAIIRDTDKDRFALYAQKWFNFNNIRQPNRNRLLWRDNDVDGLKTGHTEASGYNLVATANKNGMRLITVVLGAPDDRVRHDEGYRLLTYGYRFFETHKVFAEQEPVAEARVWMGKKKELPLGLTEAVYVTIPQGQFEQLDAKITTHSSIKAPITLGEPYGTLTITINGKTLVEKPLLALEAIEPGGAWTRMTDFVGLNVKKLTGKHTEESIQATMPAEEPTA